MHKVSSYRCSIFRDERGLTGLCVVPQFDSNADTILNALEFAAATIDRTLIAFGDELVTEIRTSPNNSSFFTTLPDFEIKAAHARLASSVDLLMVAPLVPLSQRPAWEAYSASHQNWITKAQGQSEQTWEWFYNVYGQPDSAGIHEGHVGYTEEPMDHGEDDINHDDEMDHDEDDLKHGEESSNISQEHEGHHRLRLFRRTQMSGMPTNPDDPYSTAESGTGTHQGHEDLEEMLNHTSSETTHNSFEDNDGHQGHDMSGYGTMGVTSDATKIIPFIHAATEAATAEPSKDESLFAPIWQVRYTGRQFFPKLLQSGFLTRLFFVCADLSTAQSCTCYDILVREL